MRIPPLNSFGASGAKNVVKKSSLTNLNFIKQLQCDTISFTSKEKYYRKYITLPTEITEILSVKDAEDMFKNMENIASGRTKKKPVGYSQAYKIYSNPWLKDCYFLQGQEENKNSIILLTENKIGYPIWYDNSSKMKIIKCV